MTPIVAQAVFFLLLIPPHVYGFYKAATGNKFWLVWVCFLIAANYVDSAFKKDTLVLAFFTELLGDEK